MALAMPTATTARATTFTIHVTTTVTTTIMGADFFSLPGNWRERALESLRELEPELRELSWELAWREGWDQCAQIARQRIAELEKANDSH